MPHHETGPDGLPIPPQDHYRDVSGPLSISLDVALVLANILPIVVVCRFKRTRERLTTDELVLALSITDILSVVVPQPLGLISYFTHRWYGGVRACEFYQLTTVWFQLASMCLVTYMCIDRCVVLKRTMTYKPQETDHSRTRGIISAIYLLTLLIVCLPFLGMAPKAMSTSGKSCSSWIVSQPSSPKEMVFFSVFLVVGYANLLVAVIVNTKVVHKLWKFQRTFGNKSADRRLSNIMADVDKRTVVDFTTMTIVVTVVFYLTWLPALLMLTLEQSGCSVSAAAVMYALLSTTLTGLLNPVIYATFSRSYRRGYKRIGLGLLRIVFGCPQPKLDVIDDVSTQAKRMRSANSTTNSIAALLPRDNSLCSSTLNNGDVVRSQSHITSVLLEDQNAYDNELANDICTPMTENSLFSREYELKLGRSVKGSSNHTRPYRVNGCTSLVDISLQEKTYFDEGLMTADEEMSMPEREFCGSKLSLISSDSDISGPMSSDSSLFSPEEYRQTYLQSVALQESII